MDGEPIDGIGAGLVIFIGIARGDEIPQIDYIVSKSVDLRIFENESGRLDRSALDVGADLLVISQFTLYADTRRGRRPSFSQAAPPSEASDTFDAVLEAYRRTGLTVGAGRFRARMSVSLCNEGPVTIMLDSDDQLRPRRA